MIRGIHGTRAGHDGYGAYLGHGPGAEGVTHEIRELFRRKKPAVTPAPANLPEIMSALERYISQPFPPGQYRPHVVAERMIMFRAYARIALEKGKTDRMLRFCKEILSNGKIPDMYAPVLSVTRLTIRKRDGHFANEHKFLKELCDAKTSPTLTSRGRGHVRNEMKSMKRIAGSFSKFSPNQYRQYLPHNLR